MKTDGRRIEIKEIEEENSPNSYEVTFPTYSVKRRYVANKIPSNPVLETDQDHYLLEMKICSEEGGQIQVHLHLPFDIGHATSEDIPRVERRMYDQAREDIVAEFGDVEVTDSTHFAEKTE